jgi:Raf kinase inhibitor-like YbhB/YbcL family protein
MLEKLPDVIGHALRNQRAGLDHVVFNEIDLRAGMAALAVTSLAFADHAPIPVPYTADGEGLSPPLQWSGVPPAAQSLLLIVEDADSPTPRPLVHAIVVDLPAADGSLPEGALKSPDHDGSGDLKTGRNSYLQAGWLPPDPPPGHGTHRYAFQLYALAAGPAFEGTPGRDAVVAALRERALASGLLIGTYERPDGSVKAGHEVEEPAAVTVPGVVPLAPG